MKLEVPFYKQTTPLNCGPAALRMAISYLDKDLGLKIFEDKMGIRKGEGISTIKIATTAALSGYGVDFYSKHILFNEENSKLDYYKKHGDINLEQSKKLVEEARKAGLNVEERSLQLKEILKLLSELSIPIILLDWNIVEDRKKEGYQGHFVPIVGYDKENVYVHNPSLEENKKSMLIKREIFNKARKSQGTDEDLVIVHKK